MKKAFLLVALAAVTLVGCKSNEADHHGKRDHRHEMTQDHRPNPEEMKQRKAEMEAKKAEREAKVNEAWAKFDKLSDAEKKAWIEESKNTINRRDSIQKAKQAEMEAKWSKFDNASMEEQVELLKMRGVVYREHVHAERPNHGGHGHKHDENCNHEHGAAKFPLQELQK